MQYHIPHFINFISINRGSSLPVFLLEKIDELLDINVFKKYSSPFIPTAYTYHNQHHILIKNNKTEVLSIRK